MIKKIIITIIISIVIGALITLFWNKFDPKSQTLTLPLSQITNSKPTPSPSQIPQKPPLDSSSNLEQETDNLIPEDFSQDLEDLKKEAQTF